MEQYDVLKGIKKVGFFFLLGIGYAIWLTNTGIGIPCIFYEVTGLYCPGCGITRMSLSLLKGEIEEAFHYNGAVMIGIPILYVLGIFHLLSYHKMKPSTRKRIENIILIFLIFCFLVFGILRNIPAFSWLAPKD